MGLPAVAEHGVLALSPHPDDVAFSIGGLLRRLAAAAPVGVVTVFSRARWAPNLRQSDAAEITRLRRLEDEEYCRRIGCDRIDLGLPDTGLRGYDDVSERGDVLADDPAPDDLRAALAPLLGGGPLILCPLALGKHIDHRLVRDLLLEELLEQPRSPTAPPVAFYEDLPYATELSEAELLRRVETVLPGPAPVLLPLPDAGRSKLEDVEVYRSQVRPSDRAAIRAHGRRMAPGGFAERLWWAG